MDTKALEQRTVKRTKMVVGLKLPRPQAADLVVHSLDVSSSGAKIGALRECVEPGSLLVLQRKHIRVQGRVVWTRQIAPKEIQIGIEFLAPDPRFWGFDLDDNCAGVWLSECER